MIILGISAFFHDSSACIIKDGRIIAAAEEERFTRKKHDLSFPFNSINFCLKRANITIKEVDYIAFYEKPLLKFERVVSQFIETFPKGLWAFYKTMPSWINEKLRVQSIIKRKLKYKGNIAFVEHHLCHAASSYLVSPFEESAIPTIDGVGEWSTTTIGYAKGNEIKLTKDIKFPHSLGLLYSTLTAHLGFKVNNDEYKVMGLAPYGEPIYLEKLRKLIDVKDDGSYELDMSYFVFHHKMQMPSKKFIREFGLIRKGEIQKFHKDLAASLQKLTEEILIKILNNLHEQTKSDNLCIAGGVALNSVANGKILINTKFKEIYIQPAAGDGGTSLGAAAYIYTLATEKRPEVLRSAYLGPEYLSETIKKFLDSNKIKYTEFKDKNKLLDHVAKLIYQNNVLGWFQGRMEFGPRALGSRSILSNPCNPEMKEILNSKVKHREMFRPFAPAICEDDANEYFECDKPIPIPTDFMLMVYPIRKNKRKLIPSVTHVDGSGRLQTIRKEQNEDYYNLIKKFGKLSKVPILINTSFNIRGEPIVCSPYNAYRCMMGTGIDYLVMDRFLIKRLDNPKDMWDSEKFAKD